MSEQLTADQIDAILKLGAEERYDDFIERIINAKTVWSLCSDEGWAVISDGDDEILPVWPAAELAAHWATDGYADCEAKSIPLNDWMEKWLPGMIEDKLQIAVCPDIEGEGVVVEAEELLNEIESAME